jgi:hypothetical protein
MPRKTKISIVRLKKRGDGSCQRARRVKTSFSKMSDVVLTTRNLGKKVQGVSGHI